MWISFAAVYEKRNVNANVMWEQEYGIFPLGRVAQGGTGEIAVCRKGPDDRGQCGPASLAVSDTSTSETMAPSPPPPRFR